MSRHGARGGGIFPVSMIVNADANLVLKLLQVRTGIAFWRTIPEGAERRKQRRKQRGDATSAMVMVATVLVSGMQLPGT